MAEISSHLTMAYKEMRFKRYVLKRELVANGVASDLRALFKIKELQ